MKRQGFVLILGCLLSSVVAGEERNRAIEYEAHAGYAMVSDTHYTDPAYVELGVSFPFSEQYAFSLSVFKSQDFLNSNAVFDAAISMEGMQVAAFKRWKMDSIDFDLGVGLASTHLEASFDGSTVGKTSKVVPVIEINAAYAAFAKLDVTGGGKYFNDVSGTNVHVFYVGVRYRY